MNTLSAQAIEELLNLNKHRVYPDSAKTETPAFRGGTQELADAGLIEYLRDDGLWTYWHITPRGFLHIAENE